MLILFLLLLNCKAVVLVDVEGGDYDIPYTGVNLWESGLIELIYEKRVDITPFQDIEIRSIRLDFDAESELKVYGEVRVTSEGTADTVNMFVHSDLVFLQWVIDQFASLFGYRKGVPSYVERAPVLYSDTVYGRESVVDMECNPSSYPEITECIRKGRLYIIARVVVKTDDLSRIPTGEEKYVRMENLKLHIEVDKGFSKFGSFIEIGF